MAVESIISTLDGMQHGSNDEGWNNGRESKRKIWRDVQCN